MFEFIYLIYIIGVNICKSNIILANKCNKLQKKFFCLINFLFL